MLSRERDKIKLVNIRFETDTQKYIVCLKDLYLKRESPVGEPGIDSTTANPTML